MQRSIPSCLSLPLASCLLLMSILLPAHAQDNASSEILRLSALAREAAGTEHGALFNLLCPNPVEAERERWLMQASPAALPAVAGQEPWRTAPHRVFDNLYYVGQTEYSAWAINTPEGIIIIDALYDYSVEAQIADGLRELGLDPADIRYVIVSHGHGDHVGGAAFLQERFGARIVLSETDWAIVESSTASWPKPQRDIVAFDGQQIRLGDVTVTLYVTPGHTPGTLSTIIRSVKDGNDEHVAASWGGTAFNFRGSAQYSREHWLRAYNQSAIRFQALVREAGADVLLANHPRFDGTPLKIPALAQRQPQQPHPYVSGTDSIVRYLQIAEHCAEAVRLFEQ